MRTLVRARAGSTLAELGFAYAIDREDKLASVSDAWLEFARENGAPDLTREHVVGRSLWSFVAGHETRLLYEEIFSKLRDTAGKVEIPFRCDSPERFRFMRLSLEPGSRDSIACLGILVREQARPFYSILDRAFPRTRQSLPMCSLCKRVHAFGSEWIEIEDAVRRLDLFASTELPQLAYTVCDACAARHGGRPDAASRVRRPHERAS